MTEFDRSAEEQVPETQATDEELMARLALGDTRALENLYDRHARSLFSLALRLLGDRPAAEEVVQDCFFKLWRAPHAYQPQRGRPLTWMMGVTHHRAVDELRRRRVERRVVEQSSNGEQHEPVLNEDPLQELWQDMEREAMTSALANLPQEQRLVLQLAYYQGLTQAEISKHLGQPLGTVKTRMRLGMRKLRTMPEVDHGER